MDTQTFFRSAHIGILVGLKAEADKLRPFFPQAQFAISGATARGAQSKARSLASCPDVHVLLSCGLAAGLDPHLPAGTILVPHAIQAWGQDYPTDKTLVRTLTAHATTGQDTAPLLHSDTIVTTKEDKQYLFKKTHCHSLDMESGHLAKCASSTGKPFAALRVICDPASRSLPEAASFIMEGDGRIDIKAIIGSLLRRPYQIPALIELGLDASKARRGLSHYLGSLHAHLT